MSDSRRRIRRARRSLAARAILNVELLEDRSLMNAGGLAGVLPETADPGRLLVGYRTDAGEVVRAVEIDKGVSLEQALAAYLADPDVAYAEPDYQVQVAVVPNDTFFNLEYGLHNTGQSGGTPGADIDAVRAWDITRGSTRVVVGVIDTGIDYTHIDLYQNIWINQQEIPAAVVAAIQSDPNWDVDGDGLITFRDLNAPDGRNREAGEITDLNGNTRIDGGDLLFAASTGGWANGSDADGNGYVDDLVGWNFVNNTNNPFDDNNHGTHVAGTIGATTNNGTGVAGVAWDVQLAALKFLSASGSGSLSAAVAALNYAVGKGIKISNNSWGGGGFSTTLSNAIANARNNGHVFVAAAGNAGSNNDAAPAYPASYNFDNIIAVAATDRNDNLASFSNYGATSVDLAAPGVSIASTTPNGTYSYLSGTSMATPHVSGAVALVMANDPNLSYSEVISRILTNVDTVVGLTGRVATGGRLNAFNAVDDGAPPPPPGDTTGPRIVSATPNGSGTSPVSSVRVTFSEAINAGTFDAGDVTVFTGPAGTSLTNVTVTSVANSNGTQFDVSFAALSTAGGYSFRIGPHIEDTAGNEMNQDQDGFNGEDPADAFTASFTITSTVTFTNNTPTPIRDRATVYSFITVNQPLTIADLNVQLNISHTWDSDLIIRLDGPVAGTSDRITLVNRRGGSGDNFTNTILNDEASTPISSGVAPFAGTYRPEGALSFFDGRNAAGTWTLSIQDVARFDVGTLHSWSLTFTSGSGPSGRSVGDDLELGARPVVPAPAAEGGGAAFALPDVLRAPLAAGDGIDVAQAFLLKGDTTGADEIEAASRRVAAPAPRAAVGEAEVGAEGAAADDTPLSDFALVGGSDFATDAVSEEVLIDFFASEAVEEGA